MKAIIGHTGFVGSNLVEQMEFDHTFNSENIYEILNNEYELLVCSGISGLMWYANKHPEEDLEKICDLIEVLKTVKCERIVLISTIAVCWDDMDSYGKNRLYAETELQRLFKDKLTIVRLSSLFGKNLKKNILYDLINNKLYKPLNLCDTYQWYDLGDLVNDIEYVLDKNISEINLFPEPLSIKEIVDEFFNPDLDELFTDCDTASKYDYNVNSLTDYWGTKEESLKKLKKFINEQG